MAGFVERDRCPLCASGALTTLRSIDFGHPSVWRFIDERYQGRVRRTELARRPHEVARCAICQLSFHRYVLAALLDEVLVAAAPRLLLMSRGRVELRRAPPGQVENPPSMT